MTKQESQYDRIGTPAAVTTGSPGCLRRLVLDPALLLA